MSGKVRQEEGRNLKSSRLYAKHMLHTQNHRRKVGRRWIKFRKVAEKEEEEEMEEVSEEEVGETLKGIDVKKEEEEEEMKKKQKRLEDKEEEKQREEEEV